MKVAIVVDPRERDALLTERFLTHYVDDLRVIRAGSYSMSRTLIDKHRPSIIIVDTELSDGKAIDLVQEVIERFPYTIAILTSRKPIIRPDISNVLGCLTKPYRAEELIKFVHEACKMEDDPSRSLGEHVPEKAEACG